MRINKAALRPLGVLAIFLLALTMVITTPAAQAQTAEADLSITKASSPNPVLIGSIISYTFTVANAGPQNATNVKILDVIPAGVNFQSFGTISNDGLGVYTYASRRLEIIWNALAAGSSATAQINFTTVLAGDITNTATVSSDLADLNTANNTATDTLTVNPLQADLSITKASSPNPVLIGSVISYTFTVANAGPQNATNVKILDVIPAGVNFQSFGTISNDGLGVYTYASRRLEIIWNALAAGSSATAQINFTTVLAGDITNTATVSSDLADLNTSNNTATDTLTVTPNVAPVVTQNPANQAIVYGQNASFTATSDGTPTPAVQWQASADSGASWSDIPAATDGTMTLTAPPVSASGYQYRAVFTNSAGSATSSAATLTVAPLAITVTPNSGQGKVYGSIDTALAYTYAPALVGADAFSGALSRASGENVGAYAITPGTLSAGANYSLTLAAGVTFAISPAPLTITATPDSKTYDGTTASSAAPVVSGLKGSDTVTGLAETYDNKNVGTAKTLTISAYTVNDGNGGNNYSVTTTASNSGVITARELTVSGISANNKTYDGTRTATLNLSGATLVGVVSGDDVTLNTSGAAGVFASKDPGAWAVTISGLSIQGADAGNYTIIQPSVTATISKAETTLAYNGQQFIAPGNNLLLGARLSSAAPVSGLTVDFSIYPFAGGAAIYSGSATTDNTGQASLNVPGTTTRTWFSGLYTVTASFAGNADYNPSSDVSGTLMVAAPGDAANGGGWYTLPGNGRVNFGFVVQKTPNTSPAQYKGQILLMNTGKWRLKGALDAYAQSSGKGSASGSGILYWWNPDLNGGLGDWVEANDGAPIHFAISFSAGKSGRNSTAAMGITFDYAIDAGSGVPAGYSGLPNSTPQALKGGSISSS